MKQFKLVDIVLGWVVFAIAAFVYCSVRKRVNMPEREIIYKFVF